MEYDREKHHRRSIRLKGYGEIVNQEWMQSSEIRQEIELDKYVIMPNHFHGIVIINPVGANGRSPLLTHPLIALHPDHKPCRQNHPILLMTNYDSPS